MTCIAQAKQAKYDKTMRTELDIIAEKAYVREEGLAEGREKGLAEGRAEEKKALTAEHAKKMKAESIPPEVISRVTGLGLEAIAALQHARIKPSVSPKVFCIFAANNDSCISLNFNLLTYK